MAEKQPKRCDKNDFVFCTTDVYIPNTTMKRQNYQDYLFSGLFCKRNKVENAVLYSKFYLGFAKNSVLDNI